MGMKRLTKAAMPLPGVVLLGLLAVCGAISAGASWRLSGVHAQERSASGFAEVSKETIEARIEQYSGSDAEREARLKAFFVEAGCGEHLDEQTIYPAERHLLPNVICTLPGGSDEELIVGAHYDHVAAGRGVADNWSGASLLPSLYESVKSQSRKHTILFIGFAEEEKGLVGSRYYAGEMGKPEAKKIRLMINLDTLGLGPLLLWGAHSDAKIVKALEAPGPGAVPDINPVAGLGSDRRADEDSSSFRKLHIPTLMLHSITPDKFYILHSANDNVLQIRLDDYYRSYQIAARYVAYLDGKLD